MLTIALMIVPGNGHTSKGANISKCSFCLSSFSDILDDIVPTYACRLNSTHWMLLFASFPADELILDHLSSDGLLFML